LLLTVSFLEELNFQEATKVVESYTFTSHRHYKSIGSYVVDDVKVSNNVSVGLTFDGLLKPSQVELLPRAPSEVKPTADRMFQTS
jgi:CRISPR/Cas system endoribonuclease Cas6 (RAMP superfamily)